MAKVFDIMELLEDGVRLAEKEADRIDLINQISDFCSTSGKYFNTEDYLFLESKIIEAIDYGNRIDYSYSAFEVFYKNAVHAFLIFKKNYCELYVNRKVISFAICAYGNPMYLTECLDTIFQYHRDDIEVVVLDCSSQKELSFVVNKYQDEAVRYIRSQTHGVINNEIEAARHCSGLFIFPVSDEDRLYPECFLDIIMMIKNNPQAGTVICPYRGGYRYTDENQYWAVADRNSTILEVAKIIKYKTGFGFKKDWIEIENVVSLETLGNGKAPEELYTKISDYLCQKHDVLLFSHPIYLFTNRKTGNDEMQ